MFHYLSLFPFSLTKTMQMWKRYALAGIFFSAYSILTLYIISVERDCPPESTPAVPCDPQALRKHPHVGKGGEETEAELGYHDPSNDLLELDPADTGVHGGLKRHVFERETKTTAQLLDPTLSPNNLLFVWCGSRWFEFNHYLSVLSAINVFKPDNVYFIYDVEPVLDFWLYNTFFRELKENYPFFSATLANGLDGQECEGFNKPNLDFIYTRLSRHGGLYLESTVILDKYPLDMRKYDFVYSLHNSSTYALIQAKRGVPVKTLATNPFEKKYATRRLTCAPLHSYNVHKKDEKCVTVSERIFPKDIWDANTQFGRLARRHFYRTEEIPRPVPNADTLIPNIAHVVWIGGGQMDFLFFLGVVSLVYVAKVEVVYIHGDYPPTGFYWDTIKNHPKVKHIYREVPRDVFGQKVDVLSHVTDIWRVDFMINYGGIYVDTDVAFVRPLDHEIRQYDAMATYDWTYWNDPFPDTTNFGVSMGKKGAPYWRKFQESMKWFVDSDWSWNGLRQPYRVQERHPELIWVNPHFSVICFRYKCHPTWLPNYHNESYHHENENKFTNWKTDVYAFHWTLPTPPELENEVALLKSKTMFAEIGTYILRSANILQSDNKTLVYPNGFKQAINSKP